MIITNSSNVIHFVNRPISRAEQLLFSPPHTMKYAMNNVVKIADKYYYVKRCTDRTLLNELIGSCYSSIIGLDAVDYLIGIDNNNSNCLYALSEVFFRDDYDYTTVFDYCLMKPDDSKLYSRGLSKYYVVETGVLDFFNSPQLTDNVLKMSAIDLKTGQIDRKNYNVIIRRGIDGIELEKVYDFGLSYQGVDSFHDETYYYNPFLIVRRNTISLWGLVHRYPQLYDSFSILRDVPVYDVIKGIEKRFDIKVEDTTMKDYIEQDTEFTGILRKVK